MNYTNKNIDNHRKQDCYQLDISKIQVGDILLSTGDAFVSSIIRHATVSSFSHAAIFVHEGGVLIEAIDQGVKLTSMLGRLIRDKKNIKLLRYKNAGEIDLNLLTKYAKSHIYKKYSRTGALLSITPLESQKIADDEIFCSQLIAQSFSDYGVKITEKPPSKTTPEDIAQSNLFIDVTNEAIISIKKNDTLIEHFIEDGTIKDMSNEFHELIMAIVSETKIACPFINTPKCKSLEDICYLVMHNSNLPPPIRTQLEQDFNKTVGDNLDTFFEKLCLKHRASFFSEDYARVLAMLPGVTKEQLHNQLIFYKNAIIAHKKSIAIRKANITYAELSYASAAYRNIQSLSKIDKFYRDMLRCQEVLMRSASDAACFLEQHIAEITSSNKTT